MKPDQHNQNPCLLPANFGWRRAFFFSLVLALASGAVWVMADILWRGGMTVLEWALLILFAPLFAFVAFGFVQALCGFVMLLKGDCLLINRLTGAAAHPAPTTVTALVFPICNEDVGAVYATVRGMYLDLKQRGLIGAFDFFILSDSGDSDIWIEEEIAWVELCKQLQAFGKIFYRKRQLSLNKKSGNISDFCRRWGSRYRYMIILDADSVMDSDTCLRLTAMMDANPNAGIIQTVPQLVGGTTFFARLLQFSAALYGPVFQAGMNFWQMGEGNYWGHNAIIRLKPFMEHCALPSIPGARTRFMSHDYVEAALMRKAGYAVWLAPDLSGSYEGVPPTLGDYAQRDRRWCRGNLQHRWLLFAPLHWINKLHLLLGIMSYVSSFCWFVFLVLGTIHAYHEFCNETKRSFDYDVGIVSFLDIGGIRLALILFCATLFVLLAPKMLGWILVVSNREERRRFGGVLRLTGGVLLEQLVSMLLAPVHMLSSTQALIEAWLGYAVAWSGQRRQQSERGVWRAAFVAHASHTVVGLAWAVIAFTVRPCFFAWMAPIWGGLILSIPLAVMLAGVRPGLGLKRLGLLGTPSENFPPPLMKHLWQKRTAHRKQELALDFPRRDGRLMQVVLDPYINAMHIGLVRRGRIHARTGEYFERLQLRLLRDGPSMLTLREKKALLLHVPSLSALHNNLWLTPYDKLSPWWRLAMRRYNDGNWASCVGGGPSCG